MSAPTVALVRLIDVDFHPHNVRQNLGDLRTLTASIKRHGVMQPVVVEKHKGRLRLRAGHRRTAAARLAGLTRIPAVIHAEALEDDEWLIASVQENVHRQGLSKAERKRTVQALLDLGCSKEGVAEAFGVSLSSVRNWLSSEEGRPARKSPTPLRKTELARRITDWRARGVDVETVLSELEQFAAIDYSRGGGGWTEAAGESIAARTEAKLEAVADLLEAGQAPAVIAATLQTTVGGLERFLHRQGQHELARRFHSRDRRDRRLRVVAS